MPDQDQDFNLNQQGLGEAGVGLASYLNEKGGKAQKEQFDAQNTSIVHNITDGTVQVNMPADVFKEKSEAAAKYDQISQLYMKQVQDLEQQRAQIKAHPFANTLAQIAGSMASADTNPVTRGLGQAALRLNPTDAELQAREQVPLRGALETQEGKSRYEMQGIQRQEAQARLLEQQGRNKEIERHDRETESEKRDVTTQKYTQQLATEARLIAQKASGKAMGEEAFTALAKTHHITDPEDIHNAYIAHQEEAFAIRHGEEVKKSDREEEASKKIKEQGEERRKNQIAAFEMKKDYSLFTTGEKEKLAQYKENLKKDDRLSLVTDKNKDKLGGLMQTEKYLDRVAAILSKPEYASLPGFKTAALKDIPKYLKGADRVEFENLLAHETPRVLELMLRGGYGGASILRGPSGQKLIASLGISGENTAEQAFRIMKNLNATISENRLGIAAETPLMNWSALHDLMGKDAAEVERRYHPQAQGGGGTIPTFNPQTGKVE